MAHPVHLGCGGEHGGERSLGWTNASWRSVDLKLDGDQAPNWPVPRGDPHCDCNFCRLAGLWTGIRGHHEQAPLALQAECRFGSYLKKTRTMRCWNETVATRACTSCSGSQDADGRNDGAMTPRRPHVRLGAAMGNEQHSFAAGDRITVVQGPFTDFKGTVVHPSPEPGKVGVKLSFFGGTTRLTLDVAAVNRTATER
jgi:hypothetical protein